MDSKHTFTIDERGLSLPLEWFEKYGLGQGDEVAIVETEQGLVVLPRVEAALSALDEVGQALREKGVTLDSWMARGRAIRGDILREKYGINPGDDDF